MFKRKEKDEANIRKKIDLKAFSDRVSEHKDARKHAGSVDQNKFFNNSAKILSGRTVIDKQLYIDHDVKRGLRNANGTGVVVGLTNISEVRGYTTDKDGNKIPQEGQLLYRGYDIEDLVMNCISEDRFGFEEAAFLLIMGGLPSKSELNAFNEILSRYRDLPSGFARDMILTAPSKDIMNKLARTVLALYSYDDNPDDISVANVLRQSMLLMGYFPALISYAYQAKSLYYDNKSLHLHMPLPELSTSENILRMIRPLGEYTDFEAKLLDLCMILHAEHGGGNNSSFTTHVISSTGTDTYAAISAAVGSLKGPKHGGANIAVINMMNDIQQHVPDINKRGQLDDYLIKILKGEANDRTGLVYGMGHAIYTLSDPRARLLKSMAKKLAEKKDLLDDFLLCDYVEKRVPQLYAELKGKEVNMPANVDLYSGFVYNALDIPIDIATPLFATARLAGWSAHRIEEIVASDKLIRPAYISVQEERPYIEMKDRTNLFV